MPTLYRTVCSTDWKGRPKHNLTILGQGEFQHLTNIMNNDVQNWQTKDRQTDKEFSEEDDSPLPTYGPDNWTIENTRWEMTNPPPAPDRTCQREFVDSLNGEWSSIVYHIM